MERLVVWFQCVGRKALVASFVYSRLLQRMGHGNDGLANALFDGLSRREAFRDNETSLFCNGMRM